MLVSYLPVGSEQAQKHYAQACLDAGVAFVNAIPVFIASDPVWAAKFRDAGLPIVGIDVGEITLDPAERAIESAPRMVVLLGQHPRLAAA